MKLKKNVREVVKTVAFMLVFLAIASIAVSYNASDYDTPVEATIIWDGVEGTYSTVEDAVASINPHASSAQLVDAVEEFYSINEVSKYEVLHAGDYLIPVVK